MIQRLAILGASSRAAAFSALRAGYEVVTCDLFADADLRACGIEAHQVDQYPKGFFQWLSRERCDGWLYTGGLENYPALVDQLATQGKLLGNLGSFLRKVRSPAELSRCLGNHFPETRTSPEGLPTDGSWLAKRYRSAGGSGVCPLTDSELDGFADGPKQYFQLRVQGRPASAVFVANGQRAVLLGITEQLVGEAWTGASGFQYCGSVTGIVLPDFMKQSIQQIGQTLAEQFQLQGIFGVDLVIAGSQVWVIEVNPRWTASLELLEIAHGFCALTWHLAACLEGELLEAPVEQASRSIHNKAIIFARHAATVSKRFTSDCLARRGSLEFPELADIPNFGTALTPGDPVCTVFGSGEDRNEVITHLREKTYRLLDKLNDATHA